MLTTEQLEARRKYIGSSDIGAVLGLNPWTTAEDVRLAKCGRLEDWPGNDATRAGTYLEPAILAWAEDELDCDLQRHTMHVHANSIMCANLDAEAEIFDEVEPRRIVVEAKTSGIVGMPYGAWGTPGTNEVPPLYFVQVQHQLACAGPAYCRGYVAALIGGYGFRLYTLERDAETIDMIEAAAERFWYNYVLKDLPAPGVLATLDVLKRVKREPGLIVDVPGGEWDEFILRRKDAAAADKALDESRRIVISRMGSGDAAAVGGCVVASYAANKKGVRSLKVKE